MLMSNLLLLPAGILGKLQEHSVFGYQVEMRVDDRNGTRRFSLMSRAVCVFGYDNTDLIDFLTINVVVTIIESLTR